MIRLHLKSVCLLACYACFTFALSCVDHEVPVNLPESQCKTTSGTDRLYACEFVIERVVFLAGDGSELDVATASADMIRLSRFSAKSNTNTGSVPGSGGAAFYDAKITLRRVALPSFPVSAGYLIGYTHNPAGKLVLHTPSFPGDTYGERTKVATVPLDMAIGETRDVTIEIPFYYTMTDVGAPYGVIPVTNANSSSTSIFIDNDVTTLKFNRLEFPYNYVGNVVEAYFEKLDTKVTN